jgi:hypothetical protein
MSLEKTENKEDEMVCINFSLLQHTLDPHWDRSSNSMRVKNSPFWFTEQVARQQRDNEMHWEVVKTCCPNNKSNKATRFKSPTAVIGIKWLWCFCLCVHGIRGVDYQLGWITWDPQDTEVRKKIEKQSKNGSNSVESIENQSPDGAIVPLKWQKG